MNKYKSVWFFNLGVLDTAKVTKMLYKKGQMSFLTEEWENLLCEVQKSHSPNIFSLKQQLNS